MIDVIKDRIVRKNPFLHDWSNYGIVDIYNTTSTAQYQHYLSLTSKTGMSHDFRDLRFFQPDGREIPFWIESKTDGTSAIIWFKPYVPSLKNVYMYYGNRDAVSQSSGDKVFDFFDDFLGSSVDSTKWDTTIPTGGSIGVSNSLCTITDGSTNADPTVIIQKNAVFKDGFALISRLKSAHFQNTALIEGITCEIPTGLQIAAYPCYGNTTFGKKYYNYNGSITYGDIGGWVADTYHIFELKRASGSVFSVDRANTVSISATYPTGDGKLKYITARDLTHSGAVVTIDWCALRKYTATEPTCQFNTFGLRV